MMQQDGGPERHVISFPICRLWAEVFHVTTSSSGTVKWTQVGQKETQNCERSEQHFWLFKTILVLFTKLLSGNTL